MRKWIMLFLLVPVLCLARGGRKKQPQFDGEILSSTWNDMTAGGNKTSAASVEELRRLYVDAPLSLTDYANPIAVKREGVGGYCWRGNTGSDKNEAWRTGGGNLRVSNLTSNQFTISLWYKADDNDRNVGYATHRSVAADDGFFIQNSASGLTGVIMGHVEGPTGNWARVTTTYQQFNGVGPWTHLVMVFDGPNERLDLYVNGNLDTGTTIILGAFPESKEIVSSLNWCWGIFVNNSAGDFRGRQDEYHLFRRALTHAEVKLLYESEKSKLVE